MDENKNLPRADKLSEAIETMVDARSVAENNGAAYFYKHNGGVERLDNVIECLRWLEDIVHAANGQGRFAGIGNLAPWMASLPQDGEEGEGDGADGGQG